MTWEADPDVYCVHCGERGTVVTNESRDDYYLGPPSVCSTCRKGFYWQPFDPTPIRPGGDPGPFAELLSDACQRELRSPAIFLAEIGRAGAQPSGATGD